MTQQSWRKRRHRRTAAAAQGAAEDRQAALGLLAALARAPAQRSLRGRRQSARATARARAFKLIEIDDKHRLLEAGQARGRPRRRAGRLGPGGGGRGCARRRAAGRQVVAIDLLEMEPIAGVDVPAARFHGRRRAGAAARPCCATAAADVVLSDMAAQGTGHTRTDHLRIMGAGRGGGRVRLRGACAGRRLRLQGAPGRHRARRCWTARSGRSLAVRHVKPPASRAESAEALRHRHGLPRGARADGAVSREARSCSDDTSLRHAHSFFPGSARKAFACPQSRC
mgnify:CR=1 FL=1